MSILWCYVPPKRQTVTVSEIPEHSLESFLGVASLESASGTCHCQLLEGMTRAAFSKAGPS